MHPLHVALILARWGQDDDVLVAGLLHDAAEDSPLWPLERIEAEFGRHIALLVGELTEDKSKTWDERKRAGIERVPRLSPQAATVKAADKLHNLQSLVFELRSQPPHEVWSNFRGGREKTLAMSSELVEALAKRVDLCGHMMWRHGDEAHPHHEPEFAARDSSWWSKRPGSTWKDIIADLYMEMDPVLGRVREAIGDATLIVMSDHGFAPYRRRFSLNTWLLENGYLVLKEGASREKSEDDPARTDVYIYTVGGAVDWSKTRAYGIGFNGLYLNLQGREKDDPNTPENEAGIVDPAQAEALLREIKAKLEAYRDPKNGAQVVLRADLASEVYSAERRAEAPDLLVGYNSDYDNSDQASMGRIPDYVLSDNNLV